METGTAPISRGPTDAPALRGTFLDGFPPSAKARTHPCCEEESSYRNRQ